jgi:HTH-type transcriptional regulator / antitoxin HigA
MVNEIEPVVKMLEELAANEKQYSPGMERVIEGISRLVEQYENEIEPDPEVPAVEVLKFLMEERGLRQVDLVPAIGSRSYVSQLLSGHRPIGRAAAKKLAAFFGTQETMFL